MNIEEFLSLDYAEQQDAVTSLSYDELWDLRDALPFDMGIDEEMAYDLINEQMNYLEEETDTTQYPVSGDEE